MAAATPATLFVPRSRHVSQSPTELTLSYPGSEDTTAISLFSGSLPSSTFQSKETSRPLPLAVPWPGILIVPPDLPREAGSGASKQLQEPHGPRKPSRRDSQIQDSFQSVSSITPLHKLFPIAQLWGSVFPWKARGSLGMGEQDPARQAQAVQSSRKERLGIPGPLNIAHTPGSAASLNRL